MSIESTRKTRVEEGYGLQVQEMLDIREARSLADAIQKAKELGFLTAYVFDNFYERTKAEHYFHFLNEANRGTNKAQVPYAVYGDPSNDCKTFPLLFVSFQDMRKYLLSEKPVLNKDLSFLNLNKYTPLEVSEIGEPIDQARSEIKEAVRGQLSQ